MKNCFFCKFLRQKFWQRGKFPKLFQWKWKEFFNVFSKTEKKWFSLFFFLFILSAALLNINYYFKNTVVLAKAGGGYKEGLIGQPRFINPLYLSDNDADRDLVEILYSSLVKFDENGKITKDLAENFQIKNDGKDYVFQLKKNILWHDGKPLTVDDIIFTIEFIQAPQYKSPQRAEWSGIAVEKQENDKIAFRLQKRYSSFLETVAHLKILPEHIFQDVPPENFPWILASQEYLIGSGPFKIKEIKKDKSGYTNKIILQRNENFYAKKPFLKKISFYFYKDIEKLLEQTRTKKIDGFSISDSRYLKNLEKQGFRLYRLSLPRYFALFFNLQDSRFAKGKEMKEVFNYAIDKKEILENVFLNEGQIIESPILSDYFNFSEPSQVYEFNPNKAKEILNKQGFKENQNNKKVKIQETNATFLFKNNLKYGSKGQEVKELQKCLSKDKEVYPQGKITGEFGNDTKQAVIRFQEKYAEEILSPAGIKKGTGDVKLLTREKFNQVCQEEPKIIPLKFILTTSNKSPLTEIAEILKKQLESVGIEIEIKKISLAELETNVLTKREFEILLFGEALGQIPDLFPFWHSSQKEFPGLNITSYQSKESDDFLIKAREGLEEEERKKNLEQFQEIFLKDSPAIFLVRSYCFYFISPKIKGYKMEKISQPSNRFSKIEDMYVKTKREWK
jgi:ABC-type transport system substrate-binding protein